MLNCWNQYLNTKLWSNKAPEIIINQDIDC